MGLAHMEAFLFALKLVFWVAEPALVIFFFLVTEAILLQTAGALVFLGAAQNSLLSYQTGLIRVRHLEFLQLEHSVQNRFAYFYSPLNHAIN
jgi:hypothetical protein